MNKAIIDEFIFYPKSSIKAGEGKKTGKYPFFTSSDSQSLYSDEYLYDDEFLILGTGGLPSCNYVNGKFSLSTDNLLLKSKGNFKSKYIYYYLRYDDFNILKKGFHGAGLQHISKDYVQNIKLPTLTGKKQTQIVFILDNISKLINIQKKQITFYDELIKSRFNEMFGDPICNTKGFKWKKVNDVVSLQRGFDLPNDDRDASGSIPLYGANGLMDYHNVSKASNGVITGRSGTIGNVYYCKGEFWPLNTTLFSNNTHNNNIIYLCYLLQFFNLKRFLNGSGVPTLNRNLFNDELIIDVPLKLQNKFASFVEQIDKLKFIAHKKVELYTELFNKKMDEYFSDTQG